VVQIADIDRRKGARVKAEIVEGLPVAVEDAAEMVGQQDGVEALRKDVAEAGIGVDRQPGVIHVGQWSRFAAHSKGLKHKSIKNGYGLDG